LHSIVVPTHEKELLRMKDAHIMVSVDNRLPIIVIMDHDSLKDMHTTNVAVKPI